MQKFDIVKKLTNVNKFISHTVHRNITPLAIITRKTTMEIENLKCGGGVSHVIRHTQMNLRLFSSFPPPS